MTSRPAAVGAVTMLDLGAVGQPGGQVDLGAVHDRGDGRLGQAAPDGLGQLSRRGSVG